MSDQDAGGMNYGMLGNDLHGDLPDPLEKYSGEVEWKYLRPHFESGVLLWADPVLDLVEVATAIAGDDTGKVTRWLAAADLVKIEAIHAAQWEGGTEKFRAAVVSPFVVMQASA